MLPGAWKFGDFCWPNIGVFWLYLRLILVVSGKARTCRGGGGVVLVEEPDSVWKEALLWGWGWVREGDVEWILGK